MRGYFNNREELTSSATISGAHFESWTKAQLSEARFGPSFVPSSCRSDSERVRWLKHFGYFYALKSNPTVGSGTDIQIRVIPYYL